MSIDQENVFNDQQSDNGVFAADDNDRPVSSKKEPSKAKNSKLLIYGMLAFFVLAVGAVGVMAVIKFSKNNKSHDAMAIQATPPQVSPDIIEPAKPSIISVQKEKPTELNKPEIKTEVVQTTSPSMPNAVVDINSIPADKRDPEVSMSDFNALQQRVSTLEKLLNDQKGKTNKLESQIAAYQPVNNGKVVTNSLAKKADSYVPKKRITKHKKEIVVDDSVLFEPTLQVTKSAPTQPAEPVGRMHGQYKLKAIVEDRVWLEDPQGNSITVTQGDPVSGLGNLTAVDEHDFKVRFSTGTTLKGQ